jgi:hypothetical protein
MESIVKRPRGIPSTDKTKIIKPTTQSKPKTNKEVLKPTTTPSKPKTNKEAIKPPTETKDIVKHAQRGRPPKQEKKESSMKTHMDQKESITTTHKLRKSKQILNIPSIKEKQRDDEKSEYKKEMQAILKERLKQGKAKIILDQNIEKLEARMNGL